MITGLIIGAIILAGLAFAIYKMENAPTFEQAFPNYHPQCSDCNKGGEACPTCPFRDKNYRPHTPEQGQRFIFPCVASAAKVFNTEAVMAAMPDEDHVPNVNWSSGQDDIPHLEDVDPEAVGIFSPQDQDIQAADDRVVRCLNHLCGNENIDPVYLADTLREAHACLMRAQL